MENLAEYNKNVEKSTLAVSKVQSAGPVLERNQ